MVAAGRGERLGAERAKAFVEVGGRSLLLHALVRAHASAVVDHLIAVVPAETVGDVSAPFPVLVVAGGASRRESVRRGLAVVPVGVDFVLVHDAARCLAPPTAFDQVVAALRDGAEAVVPVVEVTDTLKHVERDRVLETVDRRRLRHVQTPQGFRLELLRRAHVEVAADHHASDDASLVEALGHEVRAVAGDDAGFKVTRPVDLALAAALLAAGARDSGPPAGT